MKTNATAGLVLMGLLMILVPGCEEDDHTPVSYTVSIGTQEWMVNNLDVDTFRNGDPIPNAETSMEWMKAMEDGTPAWCYYANDPENGVLFGKLYNWYAVTDHRGLAPASWRIPTSNEWSTLINFLGGEYQAGKKLKSTNLWQGSGLNTGGDNASGFGAKPAGFRQYDGLFLDWGLYTAFWGTDTYGEEAVFIQLYNNSENAFLSVVHYRDAGYSVRCIR